MPRKRRDRKHKNGNGEKSEDPFVDYMRQDPFVHFAADTFFKDSPALFDRSRSLMHMNDLDNMMSRFGAFSMRGFDDDQNVGVSQSFCSVSSYTNNGKHIKAMQTNTMKNGNGEIISESKGYQKNKNGFQKMAAQRRVNDKYHFVGQRQKDLTAPIEKEQRLIGIRDEKEEIDRFHRSFNQKKRKMIKPTSRKSKKIQNKKKSKYPSYNEKMKRLNAKK